MAISFVTGSATTATSGTTLDSSSLTVQTGDILCFGMGENPSVDTVTFSQTAGSATTGSITTFTQVTNTGNSLTAGYCTVTAGGTVVITGTSSVTIVNAVLVIEAYRGASAVANQTSGTSSVNSTDRTLTVTYSSNGSWIVYLVSTGPKGVNVPTISAGTNQVLEQETTVGGATGVAAYLGSNESALAGAPSTLAVHATMSISGCPSCMIGFELTAAATGIPNRVVQSNQSIQRASTF